ncbi:MAG: T9SS type A sorting domain-containing protein [Draconibacterium sp.]|nr:T9SS type A sorting domain-containing protein [Draconibacterium sp.]
MPVKDELVISYPNQPVNTRFVLYNLSGVEMITSRLTGNTTKVNMSGFNPGVYVLKIYLGNTCVTRKIMKQ